MRFIHQCLLVLLINLASLFAATAQATLNLELTQGIRAAIPLAVLPFSGERASLNPSHTSITSLTNIHEVISTDLSNSGQFQLLSLSNMPQQPDQVSDLNVSVWKKARVDNVVMGQIRPLRGHRYQVSFQLLSLYGGPVLSHVAGSATTKQQPSSSLTPNQAAAPKVGGSAAGGANNQAGSADSPSVLIAKSFTVNQAGLRQVAHHISDLIYQQLTGEPGIFSTKIAYVVVSRVPHQPTRYTLEIADVDGANVKTLLRSVQPIMSPAWSPDGRHLTYVSFETGSAAIFVQDVASGQREAVSQFPGINGAPAWSPNGDQLAFVLTRSGYPKIYLFDLNHKQLRQLTRGWSLDTEPRFSPDGHSVLFTSNRSGGPQVYQVNLESQQVQRVSFDGQYNATASYTPNAETVIMLHREGGLYNIAAYDTGNQTLKLLTADGRCHSPSVAPNGKMVVYSTQFAGRGILAMVSTDGRIKLRLPARVGDVQAPAWSPFLQNSPSHKGSE